MTDAPIVPPHQAALARELMALGHALSDFRDALRPVNDETLSGAFREVLDDAERIVGRHLARPGEYIADDMANLRSQFARRHVPREDPELGRTPSLTALRSARGSILADFDSVLAEARNLGRAPTDPSFDMPTGVEFERAGREGQLAALEQRLRRVERDLETRIEPEGRPDAAHSRQQTGLVNFYVEAMRIELTLARLEAKARDLVDFASLARAIGAVGELTADFVATVEGLRDKATKSLRQAAWAIRPGVRKVVRGLGTMVASVRRQARRALAPGRRFRDLPAAPEMIVVPAGKFLMGSADGEGGDDERPRHEVTIGRPFAVGIAPVTRGQFASFVEATNHEIDGGAHVWTGQKWELDSTKSWRDPGFRQTDEHPVVCVSWHDARAYSAWLSERTGKAYRLLSEAEWEYCCRAGRTSAYSTGDTITPEQASFARKSGTTPVSAFPPNPWGLRDMHGNVWEWCEDNWHEDYSGDPPADGSVWSGGDASFRVLRGGSWDDIPLILRSADRFRDVPGLRNVNVGFRVARTL
jgi:formylglycine-generating enzyme required for sulfatase activity